MKKIIAMKSILVASSVLIALGTSAAFAAPRDGADEAGEDGFVALFNGKDLEGWRIWGNPEGIRVVDGVIRSESKTGAYGMYYEKEEFSDFVLRVEWRVSEGGNSGVFIRHPAEGPPKENHPWEAAYEAQISCEQPRRDDSHCTGALYGYQAVNPRPDETAEKWRTYEITCKGPVITVVVDGEKVCEVDQSAREDLQNKPLKGYVGVQDSHGPEGTWIEYRKIEIKKL